MTRKISATAAKRAAANPNRNLALLALIAEYRLCLAAIAKLRPGSALFSTPPTNVAANLVLSRWWRRPALGEGASPPPAPGELGELPLRQTKRPRRTTKRGKAVPSHSLGRVVPSRRRRTTLITTRRLRRLRRFHRSGGTGVRERDGEVGGGDHGAPVDHHRGDGDRRADVDEHDADDDDDDDDAGRLGDRGGVRAAQTEPDRCASGHSE